MSGLMLWYTDRRLGDDYVPITFEDMAIHVNEMAAVAWDRDSPEILFGRELQGNLRLLIHIQKTVSGGYHRSATLHTSWGDGTCIAIWDQKLVKWRRVGSVVP